VQCVTDSSVPGGLEVVGHVEDYRGGGLGHLLGADGTVRWLGNVGEVSGACGVQDARGASAVVHLAAATDVAASWGAGFADHGVLVRNVSLSAIDGICAAQRGNC